MPSISVVTSVYNCEEYIAETIESVISQSFLDWEYILIDDCSTDGSADIIQSYAQNDSRIVFIRNEKNMGQSYNLNYGIKISKGKYIARLDHDDLCRRDRLYKQYYYMENNPQTVLVGGDFSYLRNGYETPNRKRVTNDNEVKFLAAFGIQCTAHSAFFIRKEAMIKHNIWYRPFEYSEDYGLYTELMCIGTVHILEDDLIVYRDYDGNTTSKTSEQLRYSEMKEIICRYLGIINVDGYPIIERAIQGSLNTITDYRRLIKWIRDYAEFCNIPINRNGINWSVRFAFYNLMIWQQGSIRAFGVYMISGLGYGIRHIDYDLKMLKHCLIKNKKRLLWFSGFEFFEKGKE